MSEGNFIEAVMSRGGVVLDDERGYMVCREYDAATLLFRLSRLAVACMPAVVMRVWLARRMNNASH